MDASIYRMFKRWVNIMDFIYVFDNDYDGFEVWYGGLGDTPIDWRTLCHKQPVMEHTAVFIGAEVGEGVCRRCGRWGDLTRNKTTVKV
tara:strand:+ start:5295 stop:5558 length:264 start_codon:yes stop_codon:yes gene_type:complete